jgi:hypothetical protein
MRETTYALCKVATATTNTITATATTTASDVMFLCR